MTVGVKLEKKGQFRKESWTEKQFKIMTGMAHFMISTVDKMRVLKNLLQNNIYNFFLKNQSKWNTCSGVFYSPDIYLYITFRRKY